MKNKIINMILIIFSVFVGVILRIQFTAINNI